MATPGVYDVGWISDMIQKNAQPGPDWQAAMAAYSQYERLFGRPPTQSDINRILPYYLQNTNVGNAYLEDLKDREVNSPDAVAERKRKELAEKAPTYAGDVNRSVQSLLSRGATQQELDYFGKLLASGEVDPYELDQFIQQTPEYRGIQDKSFREGLNQELTAYDTEAFGREKENVISRFAQAGRLNSPALDYALTDLMGKISSERSRYLAGVSADQYAGNKTAAREDYRTNLDRMFGEQDYGRARQDQLEDLYRNRGYEVGDYLTQRSDYMDALGRMQQKRKGGGNIFSGALGGAAVGGSVGGPWGAALGGVGGGLFGYFDQ